MVVAEPAALLLGAAAALPSGRVCAGQRLLLRRQRRDHQFDLHARSSGLAPPLSHHLRRHEAGHALAMETASAKARSSQSPQPSADDQTDTETETAASVAGQAGNPTAQARNPRQARPTRKAAASRKARDASGSGQTRAAGHASDADAKPAGCQTRANPSGHHATG